MNGLLIYVPIKGTGMKLVIPLPSARTASCSKKLAACFEISPSFVEMLCQFREEFMSSNV